MKLTLNSKTHLTKIQTRRYNIHIFFFVPDEAYYGNFVASHPIFHFGCRANPWIAKIQPSM